MDATVVEMSFATRILAPCCFRTKDYHIFFTDDVLRYFSLAHLPFKDKMAISKNKTLRLWLLCLPLSMRTRGIWTRILLAWNSSYSPANSASNETQIMCILFIKTKKPQFQGLIFEYRQIKHWGDKVIRKIIEQLCVTILEQIMKWCVHIISVIFSLPLAIQHHFYLLIIE